MFHILIAKKLSGKIPSSKRRRKEKFHWEKNDFSRLAIGNEKARDKNDNVLKTMEN